MIWWLNRSTRLSSEKAAVANLEAAVDWLQVGKWQANKELAMCLDFQVSHGNEIFDFRMVYPSVFPDAPPLIYTKDGSRISQHQYGAEGELCLEYRPDNWKTSITGAEMICSCQRLLSEEREVPGEIVHAHSAHVASLGRDLRSKHCRFLMSEGDLNAVNSLQECAFHSLSLKLRNVAPDFICSLNYVGQKDSKLWGSDLALPEGGYEETGLVVRVPKAGKLGNIDADALKSFLASIKLNDLSSTVLDCDSVKYLLIGNSDNWELFRIYGEPGSRKIIKFTVLKIPSVKKRLVNSYVSLSDKKVGIVGCGSVGSKIAASLCRSGVKNFLLLDEDIFFPDNVVRNELDLGDTGIHKAYALRDRLLRINPLADVKTLRIFLGGQESSASISGALESLGQGDLLIDATAEPKAFNIIASISTRYRKPMIWTEVFAGGIGGIVVRVRPDIDPIPLAARDQISTWCNDQGMEWASPAVSDEYHGLAEDGTPLIADDAEVTIMASHATRFALDILARPEASIFPASAYVVGLSSGWLFNEPFDTRPIKLLPEGQWGDTVDFLEEEDMVRLLKEHLPVEEKDETTATE
ncbi:ThiF family adenylyltransferase [Pleionea litopenaei]|uniref:ThiF family adenylyltransferase n=1 Tax=Pleionea litopenaei TaxID=3070815 RepID=A0AA51RUS7_9GAMM|nr:ThiF family adenylyltransferase [Pleionea sp. HL-JVS1]WMS87905.1 ThiF family adenylyltransferase [Pleionea sp. HL-JVS1]